MVKSKITSRFSCIDKIILTQTDTTVGFISQNNYKLYEIKSREPSKQFITTYSDLHSFRLSKHRVPLSKRALFRKSKKTTFIMNNKALRISPTSLHSQILRDIKWNFSTSANESGKHFSFEFCEDKADIIIHDKNGLCEKSSSSLFKINNIKTVRIR